MANPDLASFSLPFLFPSSDWKGKGKAHMLRISRVVLSTFSSRRPVIEDGEDSFLTQEKREHLKHRSQHEGLSLGGLSETAVYLVLEFPWRGRELLTFVKYWSGISAWLLLHPLILTVLQSKGCYSLYLFHFTFERIETQECQVMFPRARSLEAAATCP